MRLKPSGLKVTISLVLGILLGAFLGLHTICVGTCPSNVKEIGGFQYGLDNNSILTALIFAIPFIILIYLIYSILQRDALNHPKVTIIKSRALALRNYKNKHIFGWKDLRRQMLWESILEGIILVGVIGLMVLYFVLYVFGSGPRPELGWMLWVILGVLGVVLIAAIFYIVIFVRYLRLAKKMKN
ncbi:MAG: hypothetical protein Q8Q31_01545 [Nanoarchaeota archaeon]|nr:hypothetical protein [Nanoarchaeota archaeon]